MKDPHVIFVGRGPIGLWVALLLKLMYPHLKILMKDKYLDPKRDQVLHIDKSCFKGHERFPLLETFVKNLPESPKYPGESSIKINDLESRLIKIAKSIGIEIEQEEIQDCETQLAQKYPSAKVIVGSDGTHSIVRKQKFGPALTFNELAEMNEEELEKQFGFSSVAQTVSDTFSSFKTISNTNNDHSNLNNNNNLNSVNKQQALNKQELKYFAIVSYKVKGKTTALSKWTELPWVLLSGNHMFSEYVGIDENGISTVYMRAFIDEKTYLALRGENGQNATAKNPLSYENLEKIAGDLKKTIDLWMETRKHYKKEERLEGTPTLSTTILSIHNSEEIYKILNNVLWILAGESFAAVPFYRSINMNLLMAELVARAIGFHLFPPSPSEKQEDSKWMSAKSDVASTTTSIPVVGKVITLVTEPTNFEECIAKIKAIFSWEAFKAKAKDVGLNKVAFSRDISAFSYQSGEEFFETMTSIGRNIATTSTTSSFNLLEYLQSFFVMPFGAGVSIKIPVSKLWTPSADEKAKEKPQENIDEAVTQPSSPEIVQQTTVSVPYETEQSTQGNPTKNKN